MPQRRHFIKLISLLSLQCLIPQTVFGNDSGSNLATSAGDGDIVSKCTGYRVPHDHILKISKSAIENPPTAGILVETSPANWLAWWGAIALRHRHTIQISHAELLELKGGRAITVRDEAQVHSFVFSL